MKVKIMVRNLNYIENIEKDIKRILSKTTWDKTIDIQGYMMVEKDNGDIEYKYMPKPLQEKVINYIKSHPRSRLSKAYVNGENITFKSKGYEKPFDFSFHALNENMKNVLGLKYVEPDFELIGEKNLKIVKYDFSYKPSGYTLLKRFISDNPNNLISNFQITRFHDDSKVCEFVLKDI